MAKIRERVTTESATLVKVDIGALTGSDTRAGLSDAPPVQLLRKNLTKTDATHFIWTGTIKNGVPGDATFVVNDGKVTGTVRNGDNLYRVEPVGSGMHALIKVNEARFPPEHPPESSDKPIPPLSVISPTTPSNTPVSPVPQSAIQVDVAVAYTKAAATAVGDIIGLIKLAVREANDSFVNSDVEVALNLVDTYLLPYTEKADYSSMVTDFAGMTLVKQRRDVKGADLVILIIDQKAYCGKGYGIAPDADHAFAIVHYECATGYFSFAHEIGHLFGALHDPANESSNQPYPYGHGYQFLAPPKPWRTIMAEECMPHCERLQYWANPNVSYLGHPMGNVGVSNDARLLNERVTSVAAYRHRPQPSVASTRGETTIP